MLKYNTFFKFNLYTYFRGKTKKIFRGHHLLSTYRTFKTTYFFKNFFNYLYTLFSLNKAKMIFIQEDSFQMESLKNFIRYTGNFYTTKWVPGLITNYKRARWSYNKEGIPPMVYCPLNFLLMDYPNKQAINEARVYRLPTIILYSLIPLVYTKNTDFFYFFTSFLYNIWYVSTNN